MAISAYLTITGWIQNLRKALENPSSYLFTIVPKNTRRGEVRARSAGTLATPERGLLPPLEFISYAEESDSSSRQQVVILDVVPPGLQNGAIRD